MILLGIFIDRTENTYFTRGTCLQYLLSQMYDAPKNVDKLIALVYQEIDKIKNGNPLKTDLKKVIAIKTQEREVALESNSFWFDLLVDSYQAGKKT